MQTRVFTIEGFELYRIDVETSNAEKCEIVDFS